MSLTPFFSFGALSLLGNPKKTGLSQARPSWFPVCWLMPKTGVYISTVNVLILNFILSQKGIKKRETYLIARLTNRGSDIA